VQWHSFIHWLSTGLYLSIYLSPAIVTICLLSFFYCDRYYVCVCVHYAPGGTGPDGTELDACTY